MATGILTKWKTALLHLSIQYDFQNLTKYLISHGCNLDCQDEFGKTPLLKATYKLQNQTVNILLHADADMMLPDANGKTALQTALEFPSISECKPIINSFATKIRNMCSTNEEIVKLLSEVKCPLSQIIYFRDADLTRLIITRGYKVNQRNPSDGNTALHVAVMLLDVQNIKVLLQFGADKKIVNHEGHMPFFSIFTRKKSKISEEKDVTAKILELVMPINADWTKCDKNGQLKLYPIFVNSSIEFLRIFLKTYNLDLNATDANGKTALHYLVEHDKTDEYEVLKNFPIDVDIRDKHGRTPIHIAAMRGNASAVQFLLGKGACTDAVYNGHNPMYLVFGREATIEPQRCIALLLQNATLSQLISKGMTIYMRIFQRFENDSEAVAFSKSVTAHLAMLEMSGSLSLSFDPSVPFYLSPLEELEVYYRRLWNNRIFIVTFYHLAYKEELEEMKTEIVYGSVSLFDILVSDNSGKIISKYAWKIEKVEELWDKFFKDEYSFYYKVRLTTRFDNAKKLARWRDDVAEILSDCTGMFGMDNVVVEKIVRLLEYDDLIAFD